MAAGPEIASRGVILRQPMGTLCCAASRTPCRKESASTGEDVAPRVSRSCLGRVIGITHPS